MSDVRSELVACEEALDRSVEALSLWHQPRRSVLTMLYGTLFNLMHGSFDGQSPARPADAEALINRLSYLGRFIIRCPQLPTGASASDAVSLLVTPEFARQAQEALLYAHACELFPEVHKGWYEITGADRSFVLDQPVGPVRIAEERDVVLSEIAVPTRLHPLPPNHPMRSNLLRAPATTNGKEVLLTKFYYDHFGTLELDLVGDEGMRAIAGVSVQQFCDFQRAVAALACTWLDLAADAGRQAAAATSKQKRDDWLSEQMEWSASCLGADYIEGMLATLTALSDESLRALLDIFTLREDGQPAGEGFYPPFTTSRAKVADVS